MQAWDSTRVRYFDPLQWVTYDGPHEIALARSDPKARPARLEAVWRTAGRAARRLLGKHDQEVVFRPTADGAVIVQRRAAAGALWGDGERRTGARRRSRSAAMGCFGASTANF